MVEYFKEIEDMRENGIPSHDTMQRILVMIIPEQFEKCFSAWMSSIPQKTDGEIISIDGKTLRGSKDSENKALHMISAWANENQMVLGQISTDENSNFGKRTWAYRVP